jgi:hypothetical protein
MLVTSPQPPASFLRPRSPTVFALFSLIGLVCVLLPANEVFAGRNKSSKRRARTPVKLSIDVPDHLYRSVPKARWTEKKRKQLERTGKTELWPSKTNPRSSPIEQLMKKVGVSRRVVYMSLPGDLRDWNWEIGFGKDPVDNVVFKLETPSDVIVRDGRMFNRVRYALSSAKTAQKEGNLERAKEFEAEAEYYAKLYADGYTLNANPLLEFVTKKKADVVKISDWDAKKPTHEHDSAYLLKE